MVKGSELKQLNTSIGKNGYKTIRFGRNGEASLVHRLVYEVFNGHIPIDLFICHKDGNSLNNKLLNLYAGTQSDNMRDTVKHGKSNVAKLTEKQVLEILELKDKMLVKDVAFLYGVNRHSITNIYQGKSWKHLTRG